MWLDRTLFPHCPACRKVVRISTRPAGVARACDACGAARAFPSRTAWSAAAWWLVFTLGPAVWLAWLLLWAALAPLAYLAEACAGLPLGGFMGRQRAALWYWLWVFLTLGALTSPEREPSGACPPASPADTMPPGGSRPPG